MSYSDHRPEPALGDAGRQGEPVAPAAVEELPAAVAHGDQVLRADPGQPHAHRGGDTGGGVEERDPRVELARPVAGGGDSAVGGDLRRRVEELIAAGEQHVDPGRAGVVGEAFLRPRRERDGAGGGVADRHGVFEDLAHPLVGLERLALDDPDGREQAHRLGVTGPGGFLLHQRVDGLPVAEVVRRDGVDRHAGPLDEPGLRHRRAGAPRGAFPARNVATAVPWAPGTYGEIRNPLRIVSTGTRGSLSTMNARPSTHTAWSCARARRGSRCRAAGRHSPVRRSGTGRPGPRSGPGRPKSVTHRNHMSSIVPRIPDGGPSGGTSITIGPAVRSTKLRK